MWAEVAMVVSDFGWWEKSCAGCGRGLFSALFLVGGVEDGRAGGGWRIEGSFREES